MPTYEYQCNQCGHRFDVRQSFSDAPVSDCPECGAGVRRVLYPAGVIFKGSGWYVTDSRKQPASHSASDSGSDSSSSEKSESKPSAPSAEKKDAAAASTD